MTLDEIITKTTISMNKCHDITGNIDLNAADVLIKEACIEYARSIIPEEKPIENFKAAGLAFSLSDAMWNACRTQMLSRIEEDSK